jgi:very-short-patch-repair endonuclease
MKIELTDTARKLRGNSTDAENHLWRAIRSRQLNGFKFKRQTPFGPYVVDFICIEAKLIVEADGGQHAELAEEDAKRSAYFEAGGYQVLRFWNNEILQNLAGVLETIAGELAKKTPSPQPSPQGERESGCGLPFSIEDNSDVPSPLAGEGQDEGAFS